MKIIITALLFATPLLVYAQSKSMVVKFKQVYFIHGKVWDTKKTSVTTNKKLDLNFYREFFNEPYYFPEKFVNKKFKNQQIKIWNDPTKAKSVLSNWVYTYTYDSLSRVVLYQYSSCVICSQIAFDIRIAYDELNRPIMFSRSASFAMSQPETDSYQFVYDSNNDIVQLKRYLAGKLSQQIDKL